MTPAQIKVIIYLIIAITLMGTGAWLSYRWHEAEMLRIANERDVAKADAEAKGKRADSLQEDFDASEKISQDRGHRITELQRSNDRLRGNLNALASNPKPSNPSESDAKRWLTDDVPDLVRRLRRDDAGCPADPNVPCPPSVIRPDPGTVNGGPNGTGVGGGSGKAQGGTT